MKTTGAHDIVQAYHLRLWMTKSLLMRRPRKLLARVCTNKWLRKGQAESMNMLHASKRAGGHVGTGRNRARSSNQFQQHYITRRFHPLHWSQPCKPDDAPDMSTSPALTKSSTGLASRLDVPRSNDGARRAVGWCMPAMSSTAPSGAC